VFLNEEPDEEGEDEKDDVGAGAMGLGLIRCSSVPALAAVVAGLQQMSFLKCFFASEGRVDALLHRAQDAGRRDGVFFFPLFENWKRQRRRINATANNKT
jgi:hypothetical protein